MPTASLIEVVALPRRPARSVDRALVPRRPARSRRVPGARRTGGTRPSSVQPRREQPQHAGPGRHSVRRLHVLPPRPGVERSCLSMAWIRTIPRERSDRDAQGSLRLAGQAARRADRVHAAWAACTPSWSCSGCSCTRPSRACPSGLSPIERQLAALVTSVLNETPHCSSGLRLKLSRWARTAQLLRPGVRRSAHGALGRCAPGRDHRPRGQADATPGRGRRSRHRRAARRRAWTTWTSST